MYQPSSPDACLVFVNGLESREYDESGVGQGKGTIFLK
jgi:hypothetical protein